MVVGPDGALPLPWLADPLGAALASQRGHAVLLHAAPGVGALEFALVLAQAWLCETDAAPTGADPESARSRPCGRCGSCRQFGSKVHPDLHVLLPETLRRSLAWPLRDDKLEGEDAKRKPSRQIRIDEVRDLIDWVTKTSARGRGKVVVLHPADALNQQSASALLKTLEEPPSGTRLVLTSADPARLLPTVRSRCQLLRLPAPSPQLAASWLSQQGVEQPEVLLAAAGGRPLDALALQRAGVDAAAWAALPQAVARGHAGALTGWPVPLLVDALLKLCHDAAARSVGAAGPYFPSTAVPGGADIKALLAWAQELGRVARHADHPWHEPLLIESLVAQGRQALRASAGLHSPGAPGLATLRP